VQRSFSTSCKLTKVVQGENIQGASQEFIFWNVDSYLCTVIPPEVLGAVNNQNFVLYNAYDNILLLLYRVIMELNSY
jgi:hypothetical protein